ncbi:glycine cleavage system protein T [Shewanella mangrovi]|uniref:Glycine cleavage system protein T n=1 Tax=Shewanella mangrovi TaxID=1515746 RepID=A0A094JIU9_9GAMM|nr:tRNA-modifying protein YgfZ [Shewanella mangrovi]KFZ39132.1 glycine cleavage system protein T [Shewanella mangrovi]
MGISVTAPAWALDAGTPELLLSPLNHLGVISVTGEQNRTFIHGQVTADITAVDANDWRWGAHCDARGKMQSAFRVFSVGDALMLLMPKDTLAGDLPEFKKYAVFSKAELTDASADYSLIGVAGAQAASWISAKFAAFDASQKVSQLENGAILQDGERFIVLLPTAEAETLLAGETAVDDVAWRALEILAGYPNVPAAHQGQFVPQMCNLQAVDGISFSKGCYMGQETVARMKYRGGNKRALYILTGKASTAVTAESQLEIAMDDGFRPIGAIIEVAQQNDVVLLTAVLPNDTPVGAKLRIAEDAASDLTVAPLPYSLADTE